MIAPEFYEALRAYCIRLGGSVTSYGRTPHHNSKVGGVPQSAHQYWVAADVVYDEPVDKSLAMDTGFRLGLKVIRENDHDHLQPLEWRAG